MSDSEKQKAIGRLGSHFTLSLEEEPYRLHIIKSGWKNLYHWCWEEGDSDWSDHGLLHYSQIEVKFPILKTLSMWRDFKNA